MAPPKRDRAKVAADQLTSKAYFSGEASGFHLARILGMALWDQHVAGLTITMHLDPRREDTQASPQEVDMLKSRMADAILEIMQKKSILTITDLKRLLFRCASTIISLEQVSMFFPAHLTIL